jgi:hypothetical protein
MRKVPVRKLETRRNFFSNRVVEAWNLVPTEIKSARTVVRAYRKHTERPWGATRLNKMEMEYQEVAVVPHPEPENF